MADRKDWPQEIRKPTVLENFRPTVAERHAHIIRPKHKTRTGMSEAHLKLIRQLPCTCCATGASIHAHHLRHGPARRHTFGVKCEDRWTIPLCWIHHEDCHRTGSQYEAQWFDRFGITAVNLAAALWANTGNLSAMFRVMQAHKDAARSTTARRAAVNVLMAHGLTRAEAEEQYENGGRGLR